MKDKNKIQNFGQFKENLNISDVRDSIKNREIEIERCKLKVCELREEFRLMTKKDFNVKDKRKEIWRLQSHIADMESRNKSLKSF